MALTPENIELSKYWQEWWKIGVSAMTPVAIAILTYYISNSLNERQSYLRKGEQIILEKQKIYAKFGEGLNIIYIYASDIGDFRRYTPKEIVEKKRETDRTFFMYAPYWLPETVQKYNSFMSSAFEMYVGVGRNAKILGTSDEKKQAYKIDKKPWDPEWDDLFAGRKDVSIHDRYHALVASILNDIVTSDISKPQEPSSR